MRVRLAQAVERLMRCRHANESQCRIRTVTKLDKACMLAFVQRLWPGLQEQRRRQQEQLLLQGLEQACAQVRSATLWHAWTPNPGMLVCKDLAGAGSCCLTAPPAHRSLTLSS
jgi:hypothetical protein